MNNIDAVHLDKCISRAEDWLEKAYHTGCSATVKQAQQQIDRLRSLPRTSDDLWKYGQEIYKSVPCNSMIYEQFFYEAVLHAHEQLKYVPRIFRNAILDAAGLTVDNIHEVASDARDAVDEAYVEMYGSPSDHW